MSPQNAIKTCLIDKYADFNGRAVRSEFWWFILFLIIISIIILMPLIFFLMNSYLNQTSLLPYTNIFTATKIIYIVFSIITLLPALAVSVRRFHDCNLSGWWFFALIILGWFPLIGFITNLILFGIFCFKGNSGVNNYGINPLADNPYFYE